METVLLPEDIRTMALRIDALQMNRMRETDPKKVEENMAKARMMSQLVGDMVVSILLKQSREEQ